MRVQGSGFGVQDLNSNLGHERDDRDEPPALERVNHLREVNSSFPPLRTSDSAWRPGPQGALCFMAAMRRRRSYINKRK